MLTLRQYPLPEPPVVLPMPERDKRTIAMWNRRRTSQYHSNWRTSPFPRFHPPVSRLRWRTAIKYSSLSPFNFPCLYSSALLRCLALLTTLMSVPHRHRSPVTGNLPILPDPLKNRPASLLLVMEDSSTSIADCVRSDLHPSSTGKRLDPFAYLVA
ncbi:hypothetical protein BJ322DRAFT_282403 [Thelephora terrestris]|uniref:Uncharacterized protein n=1 Tax=Thelephora terrestris TaxID=56493 RepID=A0A9P6H6W8_9AGAM|nr:hypothetical protein BJ322DRAFT_282403 [Thelephora terrestris]